MKVSIVSCSLLSMAVVVLLLFASTGFADADDLESTVFYEFNATTPLSDNDAVITLTTDPSHEDHDAHGAHLVSWILGTKTTGGTFASVSSEISVNDTVVQTPGYTNRWGHSNDYNSQVFLQSGSEDPCALTNSNGNQSVVAVFTVTDATTNATSGSLLQHLSIRSLPVVRVNGSVTVSQVTACFGFPKDSPSATPTSSISESISISSTPTISESATISVTPSTSESSSVTPTPPESASVTPSESESITPTATTSESPSVTPSPEEDSSSTSSSSSYDDSYSYDGGYSGLKRRTIRDVNDDDDDDDNTICTTNSYFGLDFSNAANIEPPLRVVLDIYTSSDKPINEKINKAIVAGDASCPSRHSGSQRNVSYFEFDFASYSDTQATLRFSITPRDHGIVAGSTLWYLYLDYAPVDSDDEKTDIVVSLRLDNRPASSGSESSSDEDDEGGVPKGMIALFVIIGIVIVGLLAAAVVLVIRRRRANFTEIA